MKKLYLLFFFPVLVFSQVGINTTTPNAQLDIKSSNQATPANTDGLLIPKVNAFPAINPTAAQQGMLVYLTTTVGMNAPGFYYWNNPTTTWIPIKGTDTGTLDQSYDFGGAGNGRTITADTGALLIDGTDGLVSTGTLNSGAVAPSGAGIRMVWNPNKAAFRAGRVIGSEWDDVNIGQGSTGFGVFTKASGTSATSFGVSTIASGFTSTAFGSGTTASGLFSTAFGSNTIASGSFSTVFGRQNDASSFGETVFGIGATTYTPSTNGATQFRTANATDRLFVIGNAIDANNNSSVDLAERSDALIVLKNGLTRLPSTTNAMIDGADGKSVVTKEYLQTNTSGTLDQAYDFGGAGNGRTITADTGALLIDGTDGLVSTGTINSGAVAPSGAGVKMFWNPRKGAFRAGNVFGIQWDDINIGSRSVAFGFNTTARGSNSVAFGLNTVASTGNTTAFGESSSASGLNSTAFGLSNNSISFGETVFGIGATTYTPFNQFQFRIANSTDRLFVIGNAIDTNNNDTVEIAERSDALIILKNGLTRLPSTTNTMIDAADGKAIITKEWVQTNAINTAWSTTGNSSTNPITNFIGTTDDIDLVFKRNNVKAGLISITNTSFGTSSLNANTTGFQNSAFGGESLFLNTTGFNNSAFGLSSLRSNTTGTDNSAFGVGSLQENSMGLDNSAFGELSLFLNTTGSGNSAFGLLSLSANTTGTNNTAIGNRSNVATASLTNASAVGFRALVASSNSLVLGSINGVNGATASVNVGIGTVSPQTTLEVVDTNTATSATVEGIVNILTNGPQAINAGGSITLGGTITDAGTTFRHFGSIEGRKATGTTGDSSGYLHFKTNNGAALIERMRITSVGDVGIGTAFPGGQFQLTLDEGRKPGTSTWTIVSDRRLKTITGNYTKGLNDITRLNTVTYNYKNNGNRTFEDEILKTEFSGFIAQEVQQIFPEAVGTDEDGFLNLNIHPILIAQVNAIKELKVENDELKSKNDALENRLNALLSRIETLENK